MSSIQSSAAWRTLKKKFEDRIKQLQSILEQDLDPVETARIRGGIGELRQQIEQIEKPITEFETTEPVNTIMR